MSIGKLIYVYTQKKISRIILPTSPCNYTEYKYEQLKSSMRSHTCTM